MKSRKMVKRMRERTRNKKSRRVGGTRTIPGLNDNLGIIKKNLNKYYHEILKRCPNDNILLYTSLFKTITEGILSMQDKYVVEDRHIRLLNDACTLWSNLLHSPEGQCADETVQINLATVESIIVECVNKINDAFESNNQSDLVENQL